MWAYILRRAALGLLTLFVISVISFAIIQLPPGDFVSTALAELAESGTETADQFAAQLRAEYGLDRPLPVQYGIWMGRVLRGNLGTSFFHQKPVLEVIGDRLPLSMLVSVSALVFTLLIAIPIGIYSAVRQYSVGDHVATFFGFLGLATPNFLLALVMLYAGYLWLDVSLAGLFSADYVTAPWSLAKLGDLLVHLPIPAIVLGTAGAAQLIRITRANLLDEKRQPYVTTARAKGLSNRRAIRKYPVRVTMNPVVSSVGLLFPSIVSGAVIVSVVLSLPTMGPVLLSSLLSQDMYLAGAIILLLGAFTVLGVFLSDLVLMWLDPRIRRGHY